MLTCACLYERTRNPFYLSHIEDWARWVHGEIPLTEFGGLQHITIWNKHHQQLWADTLFMCALFLLKAGLVLGHEDLVENAKYQFLLHARCLQQIRSGVLTHGWAFDCRHSFAGAHWARGSAWFAVPSAEMLSMLPVRDASWRMVQTALMDQTQALWKLQRESGMFTTLLDVEEAYEETSAMAGIAYAVLSGIRSGALGEGYRDMAERAARAVIARIAPDGTVMGVSDGTGMGHDLDDYLRIRQAPTGYGQGLTFLLLTKLMEQ